MFFQQPYDFLSFPSFGSGYGTPSRKDLYYDDFGFYPENMFVRSSPKQKRVSSQNINRNPNMRSKTQPSYNKPQEIYRNESSFKNNPKRAPISRNINSQSSNTNMSASPKYASKHLGQSQDKKQMHDEFKSEKSLDPFEAFFSQDFNSKRKVDDNISTMPEELSSSNSKQIPESDTEFEENSQLYESFDEDSTVMEILSEVQNNLEKIIIPERVSNQKELLKLEEILMQNLLKLDELTVSVELREKRKSLIKEIHSKFADIDNLKKILSTEV